MPSFLKQFADLWARMKWGQRFAVVGAIVGTVGIVIAMAIYGSQPEYGVLFSDLKPAEAQAIVEKLKSSNVPYTLTSNGTVVSVPANRIAELRVQMASSGMLNGGHVGFDIFDRTSFGATEFNQKVNYQRAIEGELAKTLESMDEVDSVRVHVTQPHESIYADKTERAKASVMVKMRQGRMLSRERTEAIVNLVSSAVEGLDPADVAVMDTQGRLLSASNPGANGGGFGDAGAFSSHLEASRKFEAETAAKVVTLLEPISGVGHVRADVAANLDFNQVEKTEEKYDPKSQVIRSQQTSQEARNNPLNGPPAVAGARANDPNATVPQVVTTPTRTGDTRTATTTNFEIDKTVTRTVGGGGRISHLSVSVVVDYKNVNGVTTARTPEELKKMQDLVAAAVGVDEQRGDQIVVQTIPFDQPTVEVRNPTWLERNGELVRSLIKYGILGAVALLLLIFVVRPAKRALRQAAQSADLLAGERRTPLALGAGPAETLANNHNNLDSARTVAELEAEMEARVAHEMASAAPEAVRASTVKKQLVERSRQQPENVAMTIRSWLQETAHP